MHRYLVALLLAAPAADRGAEDPGYDYHAYNRLMIRNGVQAVLMRNGLFTSNRSLEQVFRQALAWLPNQAPAAGFDRRDLAREVRKAFPG